MGDNPFGKELLSVEDVAGYMGVGRVTVHRWCREGRLPCSKVGKAWRVRREALEDFLRQGERPVTLDGQLRAFLAVPDSVVAIASDLDLLHRLDAAFFRVGEARGGLLVKFHGGETQASPEDLREEFERNGLEAGRLMSQGRLRFVEEAKVGPSRAEVLGRLLEDEGGGGRSVWASFDWTEEVDLDEALEQQEAISELAEGAQVVVKTAVLEEAAGGWTLKEQRRAQEAHAGAIWISERGLSLNRVTPLPPR